MIFINNKLITSIYSLSHFIVDLSCAAFMYHFLVIDSGITINIAVFILLYDFLAFALQLPFGMYFNNKNKNSLVSLLGCVLILGAYLINMIPIIPVILIGVGNALFHVGGGIDILNISDKRATKIGLYVAPGALGLFLGCSINRLQYSIYIVVLLLVISIILLLFLNKKYKTSIKQDNKSIFDYNYKKRIIIYIILFTICVRGYVGFILNYDWKSSFLFSFLAIIMVVLGKAIGGIISDKFGLEKTGFLSLIISSILFVFSFNNMIIGFVSILLFNMTMPITLIMLSNYINNFGKAFGLNTIALFLGSLPSFAGISLFNKIGLPILVLISALLFFIICKGLKKYD